MAAAITILTHTPLHVLEAFFYAVSGAVLPALLWLWFWMHESHQHNEPRRVITFTFLVGMICVYGAFGLQHLADFFLEPYITHTQGSNSWIIVVLWAFFEESLKFLAAYICAFRFPSVFDEPIDAFIYLMTAALGFSALENTYFLLEPLLNGNAIETIMTGNLRFMGASLLHVVASGALSIFIGYSFYMKKVYKWLYAIVGLISASVIHAAFNYIVIMTANKSHVFIAFSYVWITTILLILALERIKLVKKF
jgi:RsiW-degrading membrane proteinase PrsW (M82 family)